MLSPPCGGVFDIGNTGGKLRLLVFYALFLLGVLLLALTICLMALNLALWSVGSGALTVVIWWLISKFMDDFAPGDEE